MCLAVPMQLCRVDRPGAAVAACNGVERAVDVSLLEAPQPGEYVIVHAGFAIARLDPAEAEARLQLFAELVERHAALTATGSSSCAT